MEWISVKDRLPDVAGYYYAKGKSSIGTAGVFLYIFGQWRDYFQMTPNAPIVVATITDITHWMPLPKPPEIDE
jgi:hypothetical protein